MKLISVIVSGGAGARLWPVSRQSFPKPFMKLRGSPLLAQAIVRGQACGAEDLLIVTGEDHLFLTRDVVGEIESKPHTRYLLEPMGRNTAPAITIAALACERDHGPEAVMLVLPADHLIPDTAAFAGCAAEAAKFALQGRLVVFGIAPTAPEIGYGYIEVAEADSKSQDVLRFVEKPVREAAIKYVASERFYWNSGMFCFTAGTILEALQRHSPELLARARAAFAQTSVQDDVTRFEAESFAAQPDISIDYAVMEHATNVTMVPATFGWSDVGSWPAVAQTHDVDANGNTASGEVMFVDTHGTHISVEGLGNKLVAAIGIRDVVIVDTPDALLVMHRDSAQQVKSVVDALKRQNHTSAFLPSIVHRPWGTYVSLREETPANGDGYKVKRITVKPGQSISLQYHHQRAEHWVVVRGKALVQIGETSYETLPGQYRFIPRGEKHRLTNTGADELVLIEVQCGPYLGEDDIVRLQDVYGRVT
jgi:mannose-1-phosphate guanylyltransferase/mannose-6-phosphate isomerase